MTAVRMDQLGELRPQLAASLLAAQGAVRPVALDVCGQVSRVSGTTIEAEGLIAPIGAQCAIAALASDSRIEADVIGFSDQKLILMPYGGTAGLGPGDRVHVTARQSLGRLSNALVGRVIDGFGNPLDRAEPVLYERQAHLDGIPVNPMERPPINSVLDTGIKAINTALTIGRGQRIGLMAGSGVGKSMLLGMLTRHTAADVVVIGMIGERGREVQDFIQNILGAEGMARAVVIAAPANSSPVARLKAAKLAHLVSEDFRDQGRHVLLLLDSLTRVAHAQREIGLAMGEPPTSKGYPPSVFSLFPQLIERPGVGRGGHGSITSFYTVLAEGDDRNDPIVDICRASLDGQIMLSRQLADAAHYPAIDLSGSISRVANSLLEPRRVLQAQRLRRLWSLYREKEDFIQVGAYDANTNAELDQAIKLHPKIVKFLQQNDEESFTLRDSWRLLQELLGESA
jgi:flagellum-specific ATP synthase